MIAIIQNGETNTNFDYNLNLNGKDVKDQAVNTKEDFEILNGCFLGNYGYMDKRELQIVKITKIIDML